MKKTLIVLLALLLALLPAFASAGQSKENPDIPVIDVDVEPEDEDEEVIPPEVEIVPDTPETEELQETMKTIYQLTIYYVYADGSTAAPTYSTTLEAGTEYSVPSPEIAGYTPSIYIVSGVMPARDVQYTVVYVSKENEDPLFPFSEMSALLNLGDYETPLGLGFTVCNVGVCFE